MLISACVGFQFCIIVVIWTYVSFFFLLFFQDEELYQLFSGIGNLGSCIEAIRVIRHSHISLGKGIAYVLFKTRVCSQIILQL